MTEEKGCKNCDALGIDSEIGVYYCCLSHRQDDLPKEFICDDYTPNKQLKRLEQENKELKAYKDVNEDFKKAWDELNRKYTEVLKLAKENADSNEYCLQELEQENKDFETLTKSLYKRIEELEKENEALAFRERFYKADYEASEQENRELKEENIKVKKEFNNLIAEIISDIEYTGEITCNGESPKEHLKKCQKALKTLEEIKNRISNIHYRPVAKMKEIEEFINEVLNESK